MIDRVEAHVIVGQISENLPGKRIVTVEVAERVSFISALAASFPGRCCWRFICRQKEAPDGIERLLL